MKLRLGYHPVSSWQVSVPAGKSQSHRALIMTALADGTSTLERLPDNDDVNATRKCLEQLGAVFETTEDHVTVHGIGGHLPEGELRLDCGASGSTLRFMIALAGLRHGKTIFTGTDRLLARPLDEYRELFTGQGLVFDHDETRLIMEGGLHGNLFSVSGERSSQFVSGLLMALPLMKEDTMLQVSGPLQSASYVDLTEQYLSLAGIRYQRQDHCWQIPGNQTYQPLHAVIGPDVSSAAPFAVLAAMTKSEVLISGLKAETKHPDMRVFDILQDSYMKAFAHLDQLRDGNFLPWMRTIAANTARDWLKKQRPLLFSELNTDEDMDEPVEERFADDRAEHLPEQVMEQKETVRLVREMRVRVCKLCKREEETTWAGPDFFCSNCRGKYRNA